MFQKLRISFASKEILWISENIEESLKQRMKIICQVKSFLSDDVLGLLFSNVAWLLRVKTLEPII